MNEIQATSFYAAIQIPGKDDLLEVTIAADDKVDAVEQIEMNFPDGAEVLALTPIADNITVH